MTFEQAKTPPQAEGFRPSHWRLIFQLSPLMLVVVFLFYLLGSHLMYLLIGTTASVPVNLPDPALLDRSEDYSDDDYARYLTQKDYDKLDALYGNVITSQKMTALGLTEETRYFADLTRIADNDQVYQERINLINGWIAHQPTSLPAHIALANIYISYAWFARGSGWGDGVSQDAWNTFFERLKIADKALEDVRESRIISPCWFSAKETVGMGLQLDNATYMKTVNDGAQHMPEMLPVYSSALVYLLPRWFGSNAEIYDLIRKSADSVPGDKGDMLYARLSVSIWSYDFSDDIIHDVGLSWPRISHGLDLLYKKYPHSQNLVNYYCALAVMAQDKATARVLFNQLSNDKALVGQGYPWQDQNTFNQNRAWANN